MITSDVNPHETFQIGKQLQMFEYWTIQGSEDSTYSLFSQFVHYFFKFWIRFSFQPSNLNIMCLMVLKSLPLLGFADSINLRKCSINNAIRP